MLIPDSNKQAMKPETKAYLLQIWQECDKEDKSTEYLLQRLCDAVPSWDHSDAAQWMMKNENNRSVMQPIVLIADNDIDIRSIEVEHAIALLEKHGYLMAPILQWQEDDIIRIIQDCGVDEPAIEEVAIVMAHVKDDLDAHRGEWLCEQISIVIRESVWEYYEKQKAIQDKP